MRSDAAPGLPMRSRAAALASFIRRVIARLSDVGLARTASSLSFTTLLAVVPLATVSFTLLARFRVFEEWLTALEAFALRQLLPATTYGALHGYISGFIDKATRLTGISILLLSLTAFFATATIEREINLIWGIRRRRSLGRRLLICTLGMTAGPLVIAASLAALTSFLAESGVGVPLRAVFAHQALKPVPLAIFTLTLTLGYLLLPARRVPWRHALVGAFAAAIGLSGAKELFGLYLASVPTYELVYGALAALPVFLVWIYVCWVIVLAGAAITATLTVDAGDEAHADRVPADDAARGHVRDAA
jgi:membrane protein